MYELITQEKADRIKYILESTGLMCEIEINELYSKYKVNVFNVTETYDYGLHGYNMKVFDLMDQNDGGKVLQHENKLYEIFIAFGEWGYKTRLKNTHITVGSSKSHEYSFQLELSQAFMDDENIYIVKNISNLAGKGALVRLYRGLGSNRANKENRREKFIEEFNGEIRKYEGKDWIVISKIPLIDLFDDNKKEETFYNLVKSILRAMVLVEGIGEEI
ncbi:hypothetical protein [Clostridium sp.]|uniref:hypothetical protein n=1 Tax=Clostridium sp. TaxID=1506 RepID=UPI00260BB5AB|nr:hypothetical protein [Clostridium sp.]